MRILTATIALAIMLAVFSVLAVIGTILHFAVIGALIVGLIAGYWIRDRHELVRHLNSRVIRGRVENR